MGVELKVPRPTFKYSISYSKKMTKYLFILIKSVHVINAGGGK